MATIKTFEELDIWKKAQQLAASIYQLCDNNNKIKFDFSLKDQIKRASFSISNNIAEGFEYSNNNDFIRFLRIAKGSCGEVKNCLLFSVRVKYTTPTEVEKELALTNQLGTQIGSLVKYLKEKKKAMDKMKVGTRNP